MTSTKERRLRRLTATFEERIKNTWLNTVTHRPLQRGDWVTTQATNLMFIQLLINWQLVMTVRLWPVRVRCGYSRRWGCSLLDCSADSYWSPHTLYRHLSILRHTNTKRYLGPRTHTLPMKRERGGGVQLWIQLSNLDFNKSNKRHHVSWAHSHEGGCSGLLMGFNSAPFMHH